MHIKGESQKKLLILHAGLKGTALYREVGRLPFNPVSF